ncbi:MAG: DNA primase [Candidatus Parcubacteria bacterium]|nr:DNA primase [Candidatus Parcubacteria bacterium]
MLNSQVDEIKSKLDIVDIISEYIQLKQAGTNWKAPCPFHNEKTPSFMVSRDKQIFHCFGCGEGGDAFTFVQKIENIEFPEALRLLADKAGVKLKKVDQTMVSQKTKLMDILKLTAEFFHKVLLSSKEGIIARNYIAKRKLNPETVSDFKIGYAPDSWDILLNLLRKKGFKDNDIFLAGLEVKNDRGQLYDRFRQRLMFPISDHNGNIVGFTGRILDESRENQGGKYVNTPQTMIYNKSLVVFGLDKAKSEIRKKDLAVVVEGNMDVIASHQAGVTNVIASSGTALTQEQLKILQRYTNNIALCFDADLAGQVAAERGIDTALSLGINVSVITLPKEIGGKTVKDPDDCIKQGVEHWQQAISEAKSIMEFYFDKVFEQFDKNNPIQKKEIAARLLKQIAKIADKVEQNHWLGKLAEKLDVPANILQETFNNLKVKNEYQKTEPRIENIAVKNREVVLAEQLFALIFKYPQNIAYLVDHLEKEMLPLNELQKIYTELVMYYNNNSGFDYFEFEKIFANQDQEIVKILSTLLLLADKDFFNFTEEQVGTEIINILCELKKSYLVKKLKQVQQLISEAEKNRDSRQIEELSKDFSALSQQLQGLKV